MAENWDNPSFKESISGENVIVNNATGGTNGSAATNQLIYSSLFHTYLAVPEW
jgi:hypothetical protein